jgi:hypothetical protein
LGTLDIRKVGCDTDFGQTLMEGALAWVLPPGQYEAISHAASVGRGGSSGQHARSSFRGGPSRVFSTTSSFRTARPGLSESGRLETIRPAITERTLRVPSAARSARQENDGDEVSSAVMKPAVRDNPEPENQSPTTAPISQEARTMSAVDGRALFAEEEGKSGVSSERGLAPATGKGIASSIQDSGVLKGNVRANHPLRMVMEEYRKRGEEVPLVQYLPVPVDGNKAYLRLKGAGLKDSIMLRKH